MKKFLATILTISFLIGTNLTALAVETVQKVEAPKWEDYVPAKYQNPREFPNKGKNIAELAVGIVLTDLLITAPIGIPMICHATTKMKNQGWYKKKQVFEAGMKEAESIQDPAQKQKYYDNLIVKCKMKKRN